MLEILRDKDNGNKSVCRMMEFFEWKRCPVFVMSIHGPSLRSRRLGYNGGVVTRAKLVQFARSLLETFRFIHFDCRMVHTDVKPENILIADVDTPKHSLGNNWVVCDFGSASLWRMDRLDADLISTRPYRAPEVILGNPWFYAADMWSIGCILFELATGQRLFEVRDDLTHLQLMEKRLGRLPENFRKKSKDSAKYFSPQGEFLRESDVIRTGKVSTKKISDVLHNDADLCDLITSMLIYDPHKRLTAEEAHHHHIFNGINWENEHVDDVGKSVSKNIVSTGDSVTTSKQVKNEDIIKFQWIPPKDDTKYEVNKKSSLRESSVPATHNGNNIAVDAQVAKHYFGKSITGESQIALPPPPPPPLSRTTTTTTTIIVKKHPREEEKQEEQEEKQQEKETETTVVKDPVIRSPKTVALTSNRTPQGHDGSVSPHRSERFCKLRGLPIGHNILMDQPPQICDSTNNKPAVTLLEPFLLNSVKPLQSDVTDISTGVTSTPGTDNKYSSPADLSEYKSPFRERLQRLLEDTETAVQPTRDSVDDLFTNEGTSAFTDNDETDVGSPLPLSLGETDTKMLTLPALQQKPFENVGTGNGNSLTLPLTGLYTQTSVLTPRVPDPGKSESLPAAVSYTNNTNTNTNTTTTTTTTTNNNNNNNNTSTTQNRRTKSTPPGLVSWSEPGLQESITPSRAAPSLSVLTAEPVKVSGITRSVFPEKSYNDNISPSSSTSAIANTTSVTTTNKSDITTNPVQGSTANTITIRHTGPYPPPSLAFRKFAQQVRPGLVTTVVNMPPTNANQSNTARTEVVKSRQRSGTQVGAPRAPPVTTSGRSHRSSSLCIPFYQQGLPQGNTSRGVSANAVIINRMNMPQLSNMFASKTPAVPAPPVQHFSAFMNGKAVPGARATQVQQPFVNSRVVKRQFIQRDALLNGSVGTRAKKIDPQERLEKRITLNNVRETALAMGVVEGRRKSDVSGAVTSNNEVSPREGNDPLYTGKGARSPREPQMQLNGPYRARRIPKVQAPE
ncbi:Protein kinase domain [Trypanosoma melophagium]|uniref:Protein kinase domain n=1 Tax=Trypanosoma melophagium TaxID=715481 RepID=UPI00351A2E9B|nr:Protein kinase domain [Trypanosoma melophagium]